MAWVRSRAELLEKLKIEQAKLTASCENYDKGNLWEADRIATSIYTLVHDGGKNSQSVLSQLGLRGPLRYISSGTKISLKNWVHQFPLLAVHVENDEPKYLPILDGAAKPSVLYGLPSSYRVMQFHEWWDDDLIIKVSEFTLTRRTLVFSLRNQDGGAHVDPVLRDADYIQLLKVPHWWVQKPGP
jgi:hypothetical protein